MLTYSVATDVALSSLFNQAAEMHIVYETFSMPKAECSLEDYEDAFAPGGERVTRSFKAEYAQSEFRCAVSDGASESCFAKYWAHQLVASYLGGTWQENLSAELLIDAQKEWQAYVGQQELPWYAAEKVQSGAMATFIGLRLQQEDCQWNAIALGDSCLFHIRENRVLTAFPLEKAAQFDNKPALLCSIPGNSRIAEGKMLRQGEWRPGDVFFIMSDALAGWFLACLESGVDVVAELAEIDDIDEFVRLVELNRSLSRSTERPAMRDDDVTMLRLKVDSKASQLNIERGALLGNEIVVTGDTLEEDCQTVERDAGGKRHLGKTCVRDYIFEGLLWLVLIFGAVCWTICLMLQRFSYPSAHTI